MHAFWFDENGGHFSEGASERRCISTVTMGRFCGLGWHFQPTAGRRQPVKMDASAWLTDEVNIYAHGHEEWLVHPFDTQSF